MYRSKRRFIRKVKIGVMKFVKCVVIVASFAAVLVFVGVLMRDGQIKNEINDPSALGDKEALVGMVKSEMRVQYEEEPEINAEDLSLVPEELQELMEKNPETKNFVMNYPEKNGSVSRKPLSEYADCQDVPLLMQWDERWGYYTYGDNVMGLTGCGPTCLSMVAIYLLGDMNMTPAWMADYSVEHGYCAVGYGTSWELMSQGAESLGLNANELPLNDNTIADNLKAGNPIICVMGPGDFTDNGHFIVLTDWEDGMVAVNDPNSKANSAKLWRFEDIKGQIKNLWAYSAH